MRLLPTKQIATHIQTGAINQGDGVACVKCTGVCQPVEGKRNACARNVAGLAQRANHALVRHARALDRSAQDSFVSLMEYKMIDVFDRNARIDRKAWGTVSQMALTPNLNTRRPFMDSTLALSAEAFKRRRTDQTGNAQRHDVGRRRKLNGKGVVSPASITAAPAPSPKSTQVARSVQSSAPSSARPQRQAHARLVLGRYSPRRHRAQIQKPAQAAETSGRTRRAQTLGYGTRLGGNKMVTVVVEQTIRSSLLASIPDTGVPARSPLRQGRRVTRWCRRGGS